MYFAVEQSEVLDIPDWIFKRVPVRMDKTQSKIYQDMEDKFLSELPEGDVVMSTNILSQLTRLIQFASNPTIVEGEVTTKHAAKWEAVQDMLKYEQLPGIIWVTYIKTGKHLKEQLLKAKYSVEMLTGATKIEDRQRIVDEFQNGEIDILIAHPAVGKFGLTLTKGRTAIYLERSYNADDYYQSLYRIKRIGTEHSPHIVIPMAETYKGGETVDHVIDRILEYRKDQNLKITSGMLQAEFKKE